MITGKEIFNFIDKRQGVTKDGEKYLCLNVLSKDNRKFSFVTKDEDIINKIFPLNIQKFSPIKLCFDFDRIYNKEKNVSYWNCEFKGVD